MKIVMTTDTYWPRVNGVTVEIDTIRKQLVRMGHSVYVIAPRYPADWRGCHVPDDERVFRFPSFSFPFSPEDRIGIPTVRRDIRRLLEDLEPDIVHSHTEFTIGFGGKSYCRLHRVPHVMTCHAYWENYLQTYFPLISPCLARKVVGAWSRADYRLIDLLTVPSRWLAELIASYNVACPIEVIPNGISPEDFSVDIVESTAARARFSREFPDLEGRRILLYAGRIAREKNIGFLLDVILRVRKTCPSALLVIAGRGPHEDRLKESVRDKGLSTHVRFVGYLDRKELSYAHSISTAFVFASKTENHSLVVIEAMMCRSPVVAVMAPGTAEAMPDLRGGYLVEEDVGEFADKVLLLLSDKSLRARKSEEAWAVAQAYTAERTTARLVKVYEKVIEARRHRHVY
jgi:1,2-diacylglycerol 3-alpha-glucosyltransferase